MPEAATNPIVLRAKAHLSHIEAGWDEDGIDHSYIPERLEKFDLLEDEKDFRPPSDYVELLERGVKWAEREESWSCGSWVEQIDPTKPPTCENARACAMGILVLCTYNGPLIRAYLDEEVDLETVCASDPDVVMAARFLEPAMGEMVARRYPEEEMPVREFPLGNQIADRTVVAKVISANDTEMNRADIAPAFRLAHEKAAEFKAAAA